MRQIIKSVCVCVCVCVRVCVCVCVCLSVRLSASTLTVAFLDRFSPKLAQTYELTKGRTSLLGGQYRTTPSPILSPKTPILGQEVQKTHANIKYSYICLKCTRITENSDMLLHFQTRAAHI